MIVVTGATGNVGRPLVQALAAAGEEVTAVSRRITEVNNAIQADLINPETLKPALDGAKAIFLLTAADFLATGNLENVLEVINEAGVPRVVLLSSQGVATKRHPSDLEDAITQSGLEWTILRPGNFASNAFQWAESIRTQRRMAAPYAEVALPAVDPQDIAEVAAAALSNPSHSGAVYTLTGPTAISPRQQAEAIEASLGEPVHFIELSREVARANMLAYMPPPVADSTLDILGAPTAEEQQVSSDVEQVLGRPAHTFADWVSRNVTAFR